MGRLRESDASDDDLEPNKGSLGPGVCVSSREEGGSVRWVDSLEYICELHFHSTQRWMYYSAVTKDYPLIALYANLR